MKKSASFPGVIFAVLVVFCAVMAQSPKSDREYNGLKGKVHSITAQNAKLSNKDGQWVEGQPQTSYSESYDEQGHRTEYIGYDYRGNMSQQTSYSIIDGNKVAKIKAFHHDYDPPPPMAPPPGASAKPGDSRYDKKYKYRYDGHKIEEVIYDNDGTPGARSVKTFDDKGNDVKFEVYTRAGRLNFRTESKYDEKGNEIEKTYYDSDGNVGNVHKYKDYEVDGEGNWVKRQSWQSKDGKAEFVPYEIERRTISYYGKGTPGESHKSGMPTILRMSGAKLVAIATRRVEPSYPPAALSAGISGAVVVEVTVNEQGNVISAVAVSGDRVLADAAVAAAKGWRFTPVQIEREPVKVIGRITFNFNR